MYCFIPSLQKQGNALALLSRFSEPELTLLLFDDVGGHNSGKSTLISRLASRTGEAPSREADGSAGARNAPGDVLDLGLSYTVLDVGDEADEGAPSLSSLLFAPAHFQPPARNARSTRRLPTPFPLSSLSLAALARPLSLNIARLAGGRSARLGAAMAVLAGLEGVDRRPRRSDQREGRYRRGLGGTGRAREA